MNDNNNYFTYRYNADYTYGAYYIFYGSKFMILGELALLIVGIYAVLKNDVLKLKKVPKEEFSR